MPLLAPLLFVTVEPVSIVWMIVVVVVLVGVVSLQVPGVRMDSMIR